MKNKRKLNIRIIATVDRVLVGEIKTSVFSGENLRIFYNDSIPVHIIRNPLHNAGCEQGRRELQLMSRVEGQRRHADALRAEQHGL